MAKQYSIRNIEDLTGIKAHTIRMWEKRYNFLTPKRTETNIRYYDEKDLKKILMAASLINNGYKISDVVKLSDEELFERILYLSGIEKIMDGEINLLLNNL